MSCCYDDESELQLIATVPTEDAQDNEQTMTTTVPIEDAKEDERALIITEEKWDEEVDPSTLCWDLKDTLFITLKQCEQTHLEYARAGFNMKNFERFKKMAAALVIQKEEEMARSLTLGNEKDVVMEESIECVPKTFLDDLMTESSSDDDSTDSLRVLSVGELLSLLEV